MPSTLTDRLTNWDFAVTMKTVETENEGLKRAYKLTIPAKDIDARVDGEIKRIAPTVRMPGFRPGKVPPNLIRKMHGEALMRDALNTAVQDGVQQLLSDKKLRPAMQPEVELDQDYETGKDAEVSVRLETLPGRARRRRSRASSSSASRSRSTRRRSTSS